jgi:hypothetical protein
MGIWLLALTVGVGAFKLLFGQVPVPGATPGFILVVGVFTLAFLGLNVVLIANGRNWARILFLVLFVAGLPMTPSALLQFDRDPTRVVLLLFQCSLQVVALVLLFLPPSNTWFRSLKAARRAVGSGA